VPEWHSSTGAATAALLRDNGPNSSPNVFLKKLSSWSTILRYERPKTMKQSGPSLMITCNDSDSGTMLGTDKGRTLVAPFTKITSLKGEQAKNET
jgi:hypothetical protein